MKSLYDKEADVLYVFEKDAKPGAIFEQCEGGIWIRKDPDTGRSNGFTIINYRRRKKDGRIGRS